MSDELEDPEQQAIDLMEAQLLSQGIGSLRYDDGQMWMFSEHVLEHLLEKARKSPQKRAILFVKSGEVA